MAQLQEETNPTDAEVLAHVAALANDLGHSITVDIGGVPVTLHPKESAEHEEQPAANQPKAKTVTPTKRKPKANAFYTEVIVGGYAKRQQRKAWASTKGKNMSGVSLSVAQRKGWASKKTGKVTKKGKSAKPTATWV